MNERGRRVTDTVKGAVELMQGLVFPILWGILLGIILVPLILLSVLGLKLLFFLVF